MITRNTKRRNSFTCNCIYSINIKRPVDQQCTNVRVQNTLNLFLAYISVLNLFICNALDIH